MTAANRIRIEFSLVEVEALLARLDGQVLDRRRAKIADSGRRKLEDAVAAKKSRRES